MANDLQSLAHTRWNYKYHTKPDTALFFSDLGFYEIARVRGRLVFMENRRNGFDSYVNGLGSPMNETYPAIAVKAKEENAEDYLGDETGINNQEYHVRGFAPKGQTPTVPSFSKVEKINMISAMPLSGDDSIGQN